MAFNSFIRLTESYNGNPVYVRWDAIYILRDISAQKATYDRPKSNTIIHSNEDSEIGVVETVEEVLALLERKRDESEVHYCTSLSNIAVDSATKVDDLRDEKFRKVINKIE